MKFFFLQTLIEIFKILVTLILLISLLDYSPLSSVWQLKELNDRFKHKIPVPIPIEVIVVSRMCN